MNTNAYDYIIAGGGLAGLTLLYYMMEQSTLQHKRILVIDNVVKNTNDRTWCFWEKGEAFYEPVVKASWKQLNFSSPTLKRTFCLTDYSYKLIQSQDYYRLIYQRVNANNVTFLTETIWSIEETGDSVQVKTDAAVYHGHYAFNSTQLFRPQLSPQNTLLQHFEGWFISAREEVFDTSIATLMDFTISQAEGIAFMYVLPLSKNDALVEFTLFSEALLKKEAYEIELKKYINNVLKIKEYQISHKEFGVIPMSKQKFEQQSHSNSRIINIGTTGGYTKASTGYTFRFVHKKVKKIALQLAQNESPNLKLSFRDKMFRWYDMTLLEVLLTKSYSGEKIFTGLFKKNNPERVLAFLADESNQLDEFKIRHSVPIMPFLKAGVKQFFEQ